MVYGKYVAVRCIYCTLVDINFSILYCQRWRANTKTSTKYFQTSVSRIHLTRRNNKYSSICYHKHPNDYRANVTHLYQNFHSWDRLRRFNSEAIYWICIHRLLFTVPISIFPFTHNDDKIFRMIIVILNPYISLSLNLAGCIFFKVIESNIEILMDLKWSTISNA